MIRHNKTKLSAVLITALLCLLVSGCHINIVNETSAVRETQQVSQESEKNTDESIRNTESSLTDKINKTESSTKASQTVSEQQSSSQESDESEPEFVDFSDEGKDMTLKELYENSGYNALIEGAIEQYANDNYNIGISIEGENHIIVYVVLKQQLDPGQVNDSMIESYFSGIQSQAGTYIGLLEGATTTDNISITAVLINADGSRIASRTFTAANTSASEEETAPGMGLETLAESDILQSVLVETGEQFGISASEITVSIENEHTLVISVPITQDLSDPEIAAIKQKAESYADQMTLLSSSIQTLSGDNSAQAVLRIIDSEGNVIAQ